MWLTIQKDTYKHEFQPPLATHLFFKNFLCELESISPKKIIVQPAPPSIMKFNVDGVVAKNNDRGASAVVCHDEHGSYSLRPIKIISTLSRFRYIQSLFKQI
jgi:hypothetical protein